MRGPDFDRRKVAIFLGLGMGFAASTGLFMALGYFLDRWLGTDPLLMVLGAMLGAATGFYNLYRQALAEERRDKSEPENREPS